MMNDLTLPTAIKILHKNKNDTQGNKSAKKQIKREQRLFELLSSVDNANNVIKYYGHTKIQGHFAIVLEFANKGDLNALINNVSNSNPISPTNTRYLITDIANGVSQLHAAGIIHCDLKPENILVIENNLGDLHAKIADLGLSKETKDKRSSCGTLFYIAPETLLKIRQDKQSDVYSTSFVIWETVAAPRRITNVIPSKTSHQFTKHILHGERPPIDDNFPQIIGSWIKRGWTQTPEYRPTAAEMATAFNALTDEDMKQTYENQKKTI